MLEAALQQASCLAVWAVSDYPAYIYAHPPPPPKTAEAKAHVGRRRSVGEAGLTQGPGEQSCSGRDAGQRGQSLLTILLESELKHNCFFNTTTKYC